MKFRESPEFRKQKLLKKEPKEPEIKNPEIAELEGPMKKILQEMKEDIDKGEYSVILGEDASGRLPALLFRHILKSLYEEKGFPSPETLFFAGKLIYGQVLREKVILGFANFIKKSGVQKNAENKKALVVTDTISSGDHLLPYTEVLRALKINFDIATIGFRVTDVPKNRTEEHHKNIEKILGGKIFWGMDNTPLIYQMNEISGVRKSYGSDLFVEPFLQSGQLKFVKERLSRERVAARQDIKILAKKLAQWYKEENRNVDR